MRTSPLCPGLPVFELTDLRRLALIVALMIFHVGSTWAVPLASDSLTYNPGLLAGNNGGTGWSGAWATNGFNNSIVVVDSSGSPLAFTPPGGSTIHGGGRAVDTVAGASNVNQPVANRPLSVSLSSPFYVGYLVRTVGGAWDGNNTFSLHLSDSAGNVGTNTLTFGVRSSSNAADPSSTNHFMARAGTGSPVAGSAFGGLLSSDTTYYLVARLSKVGGSGTYNQIEMWRDPGVGAEGAPEGILTLALGAGLASVSHVVIRAAALTADDVIRMDELVLGTAWDDVVPPAAGNQPPSVSLTNPAGGAAFLSPASILMEAEASDVDGSVTNVAFYADGSKLGDDATSPYSYNWNGVTVGAYALTAVATDNLGLSATSAVVNITVTNAAAGPSVDTFTLIHPDTQLPVPGHDPLTNGAVINVAVTGTNYNVRANTSPDSDFGSVEFSLSGATLRTQVENVHPWALFGDNSGTFLNGSFNLGAHTLTGTPYDANGGGVGGGNGGTPLVVNFTVIATAPPTNNPPVVTLLSPTNAATYTEPATVQFQATVVPGDGVVTNVEFYAGTAKVGAAAGSPHDFTWNNVPAGAYSLTARALDDLGSVGISPVAIISVLSTNTRTNGIVSGELKKWHCVSVTFDGPTTSETNATNPFRNYRLNVAFTHTNSGKVYVVPGFFAADGNAADTSADRGDKWQVRFAPDEPGDWTYVASFRTGTDVAIDDNPAAGSPTSFDGSSGSFTIAASDKVAPDFRARGRLQYVGRHHLQFAETGEYFLKAGVDSPENYLAYADIDDTPNTMNGGNNTNLLKYYGPHASDYDTSEAAAYTWQGGKGSNILGTVKYLADEGMNAQSFLTFSMDGDDDNVFPHRLTGTVADYEAVADNQRWNSGTVYKDRFDVSKLEQWNRIFSYLQAKGLYLHFKTQETENDQRMDGGNVGTERKLYYRELIARFGCHLALNWNLGEENSQTEQQRKDMARYFYDQDPYRHNVVLHTFPGDKNAVYTPLLGENSKLTGLSLQSSPGSIFSDTLMWVSNSAAAGKPWVVANDEQGSATIGIQCDSLDPEHDGVRRDVIWGHFMAGGAGVESYFGYATCGTSGKGAASDLSLEDFRTRDLWWDQCRFALGFFNENRVPFWEMQNRDALLSGVSGAHCLAQTGVGYVAYLPASGVASLDLTGVPGDFTVAWFDPFLGGGLQNGSVTQVAGGGVVSLGAPPAYSHKDWVALVRAVVPPQFLGIALQGQNTVITWTNSGFKLQSADEVAGTYVTLPAATSPYTNAPADADKYFRLIHAP